MEWVIIDDKEIVECNSKTTNKDCYFTDFEIERKAYSPDDIATLSNKIREAFERHMKCIRKKNTTGVTKVEVQIVTYENGEYEYTIRGTRYALAVLSLDCCHFIIFNEKIEDSVSIIAEKYKYNEWYRIVARVPYEDYKDEYRNYIKNSKQVLSTLKERDIPPSAAWVRFREATDRDKKYNFPFIRHDDECLMYVSGTICGLGIVSMFTIDDNFTMHSSDYLNVYENVLLRMEIINFPYKYSYLDGFLDSDSD